MLFSSNQMNSGLSNDNQKLRYLIKDWIKITCLAVSHSNHYIRVFSVLVWDCNVILFMHVWVCPICPIYLIIWKSLHSEKKNRLWFQCRSITVKFILQRTQYKIDLNLVTLSMSIFAGVSHLDTILMTVVWIFHFSPHCCINAIVTREILDCERNNDNFPWK